MHGSLEKIAIHMRIGHDTILLAPPSLKKETAWFVTIIVPD